MTDSRTQASQDLQLLRNPAVWLCALAAAFTVGTAQAANTPDNLQVPANADSMSPRQAYEHDKAFCNSGQATQPRALCLQEAARAYRENLAGRLDTNVAQASSDSVSSSGTSSAADTSARASARSGARSDRN